METDIVITATNGGGADSVVLQLVVSRDAAREPAEEVEAPPLMPAYPTFEADDYEPGKNSWYTLNFSIDKVFNGGADTMTIKLEEFGVPSSISTNGIAIVATEPASDDGFDDEGFHL